MQVSFPKPSEFLLRLAIAVSFLYPPFDAITDPYSWIGYFPAFVTDFAAPHTLLLLHVFGIIEVALAIWILVGKRIWIPASIMALMLFAIVVFNMNQFQVLFRDVSIALAALALAWRKFPRKNGTGST